MLGGIQDKVETYRKGSFLGNEACGASIAERLIYNHNRQTRCLRILKSIFIKLVPGCEIRKSKQDRRFPALTEASSGPATDH